MTSVSFAVTVTDVLGGPCRPHDAFSPQSLQRAVAAALPGGAEMLQGVRPNAENGDAQLIVQAVANGAADMQALRSVVLSGDFGVALGRALNAEERLDKVKLAPGAPVRLGGLKQRPNLNGSQAILIEPTQDGSRWQLRAGAEVLSIRPASPGVVIHHLLDFILPQDCPVAQTSQPGC